MRLTRAVLVDIRNRSVDKKIWFRTLSHFERSLINLTITVVDEVKSSKLSGILNSIILRLEDAFESSFQRRAWQKGRAMAEKLVQIAYSWGYKAALEWLKDRTYALYLGVSSMNALKMFRSIS